MPRLTELDLTANTIEVLPEEIGELAESLEILKLGRNMLTSLPGSIGGMQTLKVLEVYDNQLRRLPRSLRRLKMLEVLKLDNNPLEKPPGKVCARGRIHVFKWLESEAKAEFHQRENPAAISTVDAWDGDTASVADRPKTFTPYRQGSRVSLGAPSPPTSPLGAPSIDGTAVSDDGVPQLQLRDPSPRGQVRPTTQLWEPITDDASGKRYFRNPLSGETVDELPGPIAQPGSTGEALPDPPANGADRVHTAAATEEKAGNNAGNGGGAEAVSDTDAGQQAPLNARFPRMEMAKKSDDDRAGADELSASSVVDRDPVDEARQFAEFEAAEEARVAAQEKKAKEPRTAAEDQSAAELRVPTEEKIAAEQLARQRAAASDARSVALRKAAEDVERAAEMKRTEESKVAAEARADEFSRSPPVIEHRQSSRIMAGGILLSSRQNSGMASPESVPPTEVTAAELSTSPPTVVPRQSSRILDGGILLSSRQNSRVLSPPRTVAAEGTAQASSPSFLRDAAARNRSRLQNFGASHLLLNVEGLLMPVSPSGQVFAWSWRELSTHFVRRRQQSSECMAVVATGLSEALTLLEQRLMAPIAGVSSATDLPQHLANGVVLRQYLRCVRHRTFGGRAPMTVDVRCCETEPHLTAANSVPPQGLSGIRLLRAKRDVAAFLGEAHEMGLPCTGATDSMGSEILRAVPSGRLIELLRATLFM